MKFINNDSKRFAVCCFTLLLNCTTLKAFDEILSLIFIVHLSHSKNTDFDASLGALQQLIAERPKLDDKTDEIIRSYMKLNKPQDNCNLIEQDQSTEKNDKDVFIDRGLTIKSNSPFTKHSIDLQKKIVSNINEACDSNYSNELINSDFVKLLQDQFLPYAFIWCGFAFQSLVVKDPISRLTNGCIERFFGIRKSYIPKPLLPVHYFNKVVSVTIGQTKRKAQELQEIEFEEQEDFDEEPQEDEPNYEGKI